MDKLGDRLAELRNDMRLNQKDVADHLHVTPATISNYECGKHLPDVETLSKLATYYDVTLDYITGITSSKMSLKSLNEPFTEDITLLELISKLQNLPSAQRRTVVDVISACESQGIMQKQKRSV